MEVMEPPRTGDVRSYPAGPRRVLIAAGVLTALCAGCHDSPADPLAAITTVETVPALDLSTPLPALNELAERVPDDAGLRALVVEWDSSWEEDDGEVVRVALRGQAVPILYEALGESSARTALASLAWLRSDPGIPDALPGSLADPLREALLMADRGEAALAAGKGEQALGWALAAADRARSVTTEAVARRLVRRGEALLAREPAPEVDLDRATHLMNGARRALGEGDFTRAIQRAFYACQVLEGPWVPDPETGERRIPSTSPPSAPGPGPTRSR